MIATEQVLIWKPIAKAIDIAEKMYKGYNWIKSRRLSIISKEVSIYPETYGKELELFSDKEVNYKAYRYASAFTNLEISAKLIREIYKKLNDSENRI